MIKLVWPCFLLGFKGYFESIDLDLSRLTNEQMIVLRKAFDEIKLELSSMPHG